MSGLRTGAKTRAAAVTPFSEWCLALTELGDVTAAEFPEVRALRRIGRLIDPAARLSWPVPPPA